MDLVKRETALRKFSNHSADHEQIRAALGNSKAQTMEADDRAAKQIGKSAEPPISGRTAESEMGHGHLIHPDQTGHPVSLHHPEFVRPMHRSVPHRNHTDRTSDHRHRAGCSEKE